MKAENTVDLKTFENNSFDRGASKYRETLWLLIRSILFIGSPFPLYSFKRFVLRVFGAKIGKGVIVKPGAKITFPWKLEVGDFAWIGEECWIINLDLVRIGNNVCIAQRAMLCTGNHDYSRSTFDLMTSPIMLEEGAWIAANAWVGPGVTVGSHALLTAGSVATRDLEPYKIYQGNPARAIKDRQIKP